MTVLESILAWLAGWILNYLLGKASTAIKKAEDQILLDHDREVTNEQNVKAYEEAKTREDRIRAATNLLNGVRGTKTLP